MRGRPWNSYDLKSGHSLRDTWEEISQGYPFQCILGVGRSISGLELLEERMLVLGSFLGGSAKAGSSIRTYHVHELSIGRRKQEGDVQRQEVLAL